VRAKTELGAPLSDELGLLGEPLGLTGRCTGNGAGRHLGPRSGQVHGQRPRDGTGRALSLGDELGAARCLLALHCRRQTRRTAGRLLGEPLGTTTDTLGEPVGVDWVWSTRGRSGRAGKS
jgi:hypothetical protein